MKELDRFTVETIQSMGLDGLDDPRNRIMVFNPEAEHPMPSVVETRIFQRDREGNMMINYWTVSGDLIIYYPEAEKNLHPHKYFTTRLRTPQGDMKYKMPKGQPTHPWFSPITVNAYRDGAKIETLYITEGVKKAFMANLYGVHVVGLASITCYASEGKLHADIIRLIEKCQVDNVVILWDGDCLQVSRKGIQVREEATKRPFGFFNAAKNIRKLIGMADWQKPRATPRIFFQHVNSDSFPNEMPKGLDDIIMVAEIAGKEKAVINSMNPLNEKGGGYFYNLEISSTTDLLYKHFRLDDAEKFYAYHSKEIGEVEFFFRGDMYHYSEADNKLKLLQPEWAKHIYFIGDEFFEEIAVPSAHETILTKTLIHRKKETLSARYGRDFLKHLKYYHAFVNIPSHTKYERIVERDNKQYFNQYYPFPHIRQEGSYDNIMMFIKHIFGCNIITHPKTGKKIPNYELGLDYLQQLLINPTQQLPIIVLYSAENQTGKSTFGELLYQMFGDNTTFIGNKDLQSDFNEIFAGRLLAVCEETQIERRADAERIKNMSTANRMTINPKGQKQYTIDFFTKFVFFSNHRRMVYVTRHDDRYWILQVPPVAKDKRDPGLKERMWAEIPAFINFLHKREAATANEARMYFLPDLLRTQIFMDTVRVNEPAAATDLRIRIADMFMDDPDLREIEMPLGNIIEEFLPKATSRIWAMEILKDNLNVEQVRDAAGNLVNKRGEYSITKFAEYAADGAGDLVTKTVKWRGRPYLFKREAFVMEEVMEFVEAAAEQVPSLAGIDEPPW